LLLNLKENLVNIPKDEFPEPKPQDNSLEKPGSPEKSKLEHKIVNVDKKVAYQDFKDKEGKEYNDAIVSSIESLKEKKEEIK